ncbi:hypothetical protein EEL31_10860 [Brevibacillus laterosporus]|nr:hypothetical protein EEL31_10860 [Brevibacillus laterosporus]
MILFAGKNRWRTSKNRKEKAKRQKKAQKRIKPKMRKAKNLRNHSQCNTHITMQGRKMLLTFTFHPIRVLVISKRFLARKNGVLGSNRDKELVHLVIKRCTWDQ